MSLIATILVGLVAIEHIYILYLEMFAWTKPRTLKTFGIAKKDAQTTKVLAANQGLYNGFLAAGLFWGLLHTNANFGWQIQLFFILCVVVAALYGGLSAKRSILITQGLPALLAFIALLIAGI
jgi:putative membrane protein